MIEGIYKGNPESISLKLKNLERTRDMNISIFNPDNKRKYDSSSGPYVEAPFVRSILPYIQGLSKGHFIIDVNKDPRLKTEFLILTSRLKNGDILIMSSPLAVH